MFLKKVGGCVWSEKIERKIEAEDEDEDEDLL